MLKQLLVPTDGSLEAIIAARLAAHLAGRTGRMTLLHVTRDTAGTLAAAGIDAAANVIGGAMGDLTDKESLRVSEEAARILAATQEALPTPPAVATIAERGRPSAVILDALEGGSYDVAVVGTRGRGVILRTMLGSVSDAVVRYATKPVVIARQETAHVILVAADGSPSSLRAIRMAAEIACQESAPLVVLHSLEAHPSIPERLHELTVSLLREACAAASAAPRVSQQILVGDPATALVHETERRRADLIVIGRTGRTPHPRVTLGTVAHKVATGASASVLVVP